MENIKTLEDFIKEGKTKEEYIEYLKLLGRDKVYTIKR